MNYSKNILQFVAISTFIYLSVSLLYYLFPVFKSPEFERINLITDIISTNTNEPKQLQQKKEITISNAEVRKTTNNFNLYTLPAKIINFYKDTNTPSLPKLSQKLYELKHGINRRKIRIAYFGDSMIEGDLITQTIRKLLQQQFGGSGVGFVPITSASAGFRRTVYTNSSDSWIDEHFMADCPKNLLYISGHRFLSNGGWVKAIDHTVLDTVTLIEKALLCGKFNQPVVVYVNNKALTIHPNNLLNRIPLKVDYSKAIKVSIDQRALPVYGISFEAKSGIILDNFSFRGITGVELDKIDSTFLKSINSSNSYDLIVLQYGINLLFSPKNTNYDHYKKRFKPVLLKMKQCFPTAEILMVSCTDRAFRYRDEYQSAIGIDTLIKVQAQLAYDANICFYNQYATMGGKNSIVKWVNSKPALANKDYVHPNHNGAELLGNFFFNALMKEYYKYTPVLNKH